MSDSDLEVARQFLGALASAARTGDRAELYPLLSGDVVWRTPQRELHGLDEVEESLTWLRPPEHLELDFAQAAFEDLGDGRIVSDIHETYKLKDTGEFAYERDRRIELTIRDSRIERYEMRVVG
jgi:ketosteroid isomerase-like protein